MSTEIQRGEYRLIEVSIKGTSVKELVNNFEIIQDINENYFIGTIELADNIGDIEKLNLKGMDDIVIKYFTQDDVLFTWTGKVLHSSISIKNSNHIYSITFVDPIFFKLADHYSWSVSNKISNIIRRFYFDKLNAELPLNVSGTLWNFTYIFSNWPGNKIIDFLEKRAKSENSGTLFKFFRTKDAYNFKSIEDLIKHPPKHTLTYSTAPIDRGDNSTKETSYTDLNIDIFGNASNYNLGQEGNILSVIDLYKKEIKNTNTFSANKPNVKILKYRHDFKQENYVSHFDEVIGPRILKIGELNNNIISLKLPTSSIIDLGETYKVKILSARKDTKEQNNSLELSGNFICTKIVHSFGKTSESTLTLQRIISD